MIWLDEVHEGIKDHFQDLSLGGGNLAVWYYDINGNLLQIKRMFYFSLLLKLEEKP